MSYDSIDLSLLSPEMEALHDSLRWLPQAKRSGMITPYKGDNDALLNCYRKTNADPKAIAKAQRRANHSSSYSPKSETGLLATDYAIDSYNTWK